MTSEKDCSMTGRCCFITEAAGLTVVVVVVGGVGWGRCMAVLKLMVLM